MTRIVAPLAVLVCLLPAAPAAVVAPKAPPAPTAGKSNGVKSPSRTAGCAASASASADFVITAASEVQLNGRACRFKDVPNHAVITRIEVDEDTREIVRVHFSTRK